MSSPKKRIHCPHCGNQLQPFDMPLESGWDSGYHLACFNDECPYYVRGWEHMSAAYERQVSYRYRVDPATGHASPLAVWSPTALRDRILDTEPDNDKDET